MFSSEDLSNLIDSGELMLHISLKDEQQVIVTAASKLKDAELPLFIVEIEHYAEVLKKQYHSRSIEQRDHFESEEEEDDELLTS